MKMCMYVYLVCYIRLVRSAARRLSHRTTEEWGGAVFNQYWMVSAYRNFLIQCFGICLYVSSIRQSIGIDPINVI
jgi:hypothetical protein